MKPYILLALVAGLAALIVVLVGLGFYQHSQHQGDIALLQAQVDQKTLQVAAMTEAHQHALANKDAHWQNQLDAATVNHQLALGQLRNEHDSAMIAALNEAGEVCERRVLAAIEGHGEESMEQILHEKNARLRQQEALLARMQRDLATAQEANNALTADNAAFSEQVEALRKSRARMEDQHRVLTGRYSWLDAKESFIADTCLDTRRKNRREDCLRDATLAFDAMQDEWVSCSKDGVTPIWQPIAPGADTPDNGHVVFTERDTAHMVILCDPGLADSR